MSVTTERSLSSISDEETLMRFSIDLVSAARRNIGFLRIVYESQWLHQSFSIFEAIRRYDELWMPLIDELTTGLKPSMLVPPIDVEWVWFCHTLNPASYRHYCESRFSKIIGKPAIFNDENEDYALNRCREIWEIKYPLETFENEASSDIGIKHSSVLREELFRHVSKMGNLYRLFSEPYYLEIVYLMAAKQRYKGLVYMIHQFATECSYIVPTSDVLLMWITHKSYPTAYEKDVKDVEGYLEKIVRICEDVKEQHTRETKSLWETTFDQPYEKAGGVPLTSRPMQVDDLHSWDLTYTDANTKYKSLAPRFIFEVCISVKLKPQTKRDLSREFLRVRMLKRHRELKIEKPLTDFPSDSSSWRKALHLYCEFGTKGMSFEIRQRGTGCFKGSTLQESALFPWNDLLRAPSLTLGKEIDHVLRSTVSMTPPVQATYLLKCVPDRVTDDSGAMVSDVILKMNQYHPQEGRWLSRTVLDHAGRECFVMRIRVGGGFWRRGGEIPRAVKWDDRITEIRAGSWSYVTGSCSIGRSPEKVVGSARPEEPPEGYQASWSLSTGDGLLIHWNSSTSLSGLRFALNTNESTDSMVRLLLGRHMQYQLTKGVETKGEAKENKSKQDEDEEFITVIRYSEENPKGKATALLNWKLLVIDVSPEEDVVFILLICISILRSISEIKREDIGGLLVRRRIREVKVGDRDWGSVNLHPSSPNYSVSNDPCLHPWYWNTNLVMRSQLKDEYVSTQNLNYSQTEGGDRLYKSVIIP